MNSRKIFILLPDGVGLRNFAYTSFVKQGEILGWQITFWNQTPFDLKKLGYSEIKLDGKPKAITDLVKRAKITAELDHFTNKFEDSIYQSYKFPINKSGLKSSIKNAVVFFLVYLNKGEKGISRLQKKLLKSEVDSPFYKDCKELLEKEKPDIVFCTNQRPVAAIAPLLAARDLGIKTGCFIFSWDNLPKATKVIETDFYLVWSDFMKQELQKYYPEIKSKQIEVTGTPQFEVHFKAETKVSKESFYALHNLLPGRKYLCFSGDDITTSPHDELYLRDVAIAVRKMNENGANIGIIFRRCPVDFSGRYDKFIAEYKDIIV
ncbi:MAG: UDP-glycosyltransferase, partial [Leeuwenhoekiella sp.]